jgi:hypothetical protein
MLDLTDVSSSETSNGARLTPPSFPKYIADRIPANHAYHHAPVAPSATTPTDSDPDADELLRGARAPRGTLTTCSECGEPYSGSGHTCRPKVDMDDVSLTTELAYVLRDRQHAETVAAEIAGVAA